MPPPLLQLPDASAYRRHYVAACCRAAVFTNGGVRVFFRQQRFSHAFYDNWGQGGAKRQFSKMRGERMNWIRDTLESPQTVCRQGWLAKNRAHTPARGVFHLYGDFVVIVRFSLTRSGALKGNFITCYAASDSIGKITAAPLWDRAGCLALLRKNGR